MVRLPPIKGPSGDAGRQGLQVLMTNKVRSRSGKHPVKLFPGGRGQFTQMGHGGAMEGDEAGPLGEQADKIGDIAETDEILGLSGQQ